MGVESKDLMWETGDRSLENSGVRADEGTPRISSKSLFTQLRKLDREICEFSKVRILNFFFFRVAIR